MSRNLVFAAACVLLLVQAAFADQQGKAHPNVLVLYADDLGYGDLGCYGGTKVPTPRIDELADEGIRFTNCYSPASVCTPSRYNLMTGRYAWRTWVRSGTVWAYDPLLVDPERLTLADVMKSAGYRTAFIGKWHLGFGRPGMPGWSDVVGPDYNGPLRPGPLDCGFDYFWGFPHVSQFPHWIFENDGLLKPDPNDPAKIYPDPRPEHRLDYLHRSRIGAARLKASGGGLAHYEHDELSDRLTNRAIKYIEDQAESNEPFFLVVAHRNIHGPLIPASRFEGKSAIGRYGDFLLELDDSIGRILDALNHSLLSKNTIVILASDNGGVVQYKPIDYASVEGHFPNGKLRGQKTSVYEGGVRVPLIVRWPNLATKDTTDDAIVAMTDMLATFAQYFDHSVMPDEAEDSVSFLGRLTGDPSAGQGRRSVVCDSFTGVMAIRQGDWKLIQSQHGGGAGTIDLEPDPTRPAGQLFNLREDPSERNNLYRDHPDVVARLTRELSETLKRPSAELAAADLLKSSARVP